MNIEKTAKTGLKEEDAKIYNRIKIWLSIIDLVINLIIVSLLAFTEISRHLLSRLNSYTQNDYLLFILFLFAIGIMMSIITFPLDFYASYMLEHRFLLSNQNIFKWIIERSKSTAVSLSLGIPVALAFYYFLRIAGNIWWLYFSALVFALAVIMARLAPIILYPIFYKFTPLENETIKEKISGILETNNINIKGIYSFNMSKNTKKANAGFTGIGKSRRIVLSDTLINSFTPDEIAVIFAHEVGHYINRHIIKNIFLSGIIIFLSFFLCNWLYNNTLAVRGFIYIYDIAALPILFFYLSIFSMIIMPFTNIISRHYEREADSFAIKLTADKESFISSMEKLAGINLSDKDPNPVIEFLFYSHPSIKNRIGSARLISFSEEKTHKLN